MARHKRETFQLKRKLTSLKSFFIKQTGSKTLAFFLWFARKENNNCPNIKTDSWFGFNLKAELSTNTQKCIKEN